MIQIDVKDWRGYKTATVWLPAVPAQGSSFRFAGNPKLYTISFVDWSVLPNGKLDAVSIHIRESR